MKKHLILTVFFFLLIFSCSTAQPTFKNGLRLFNEKKYVEAVKVFETVLEKDPGNANAAYNIGISYIQLKDDDNALIYLNKAIEIDPFYSDAWFNISLIFFKKGEYKKAVKAAVNTSGDGLKIINNSYKKLEETGFRNRTYARIDKKYIVPNADFTFEGNEKNIYFTLSVSKNGKVEKINCGRSKNDFQQSDEDEIKDIEIKYLDDNKMCDFYKPFLSSLEFIPAYDFNKNELKDSEEIGFITLSKNKNENSKFRIANGIEITTSDKKIKSGALDKSVIDADIHRNLAKIRDCYAKKLDKQPYLRGRVVINFIIDKDGSVPVVKVSKSTMNNESVETCVADQIREIKFPAPKGDGIVLVNYPFVFKHTL